jgi:hypothetical protein
MINTPLGFLTGSELNALAVLPVKHENLRDVGENAT